MAEFASHGVGSAALTTGIIGTALGVINGGLLGGHGGIFGGHGRGYGDGGHGDNCGHHERCVDRFELLQSEKIACLEAANAKETAILSSNIAKLESEKYTNNKIAALNDRLETKIDNLAGAVEKRIDGVVAYTNAKFEQVEKCIGNQNVINAKLEGFLSCQEGQIHTLTHRLNKITKEVVPLSALCPEAMPRFNAFVTPTDTPTEAA